MTKRSIAKANKTMLSTGPTDVDKKNCFFFTNTFLVLNADQTYPIGDRDSRLDGSNVCDRERDDGTSGDNDLYGDGARLQDKKKRGCVR